MRTSTGPRYQPYLHLGNDYFCCLRFLEVEQFREISKEIWIANLPNEKKLSVTTDILKKTREANLKQAMASGAIPKDSIATESLTSKPMNLQCT